MTIEKLILKDLTRFITRKLKLQPYVRIIRKILKYSKALKNQK